MEFKINNLKKKTKARREKTGYFYVAGLPPRVEVGLNSSRCIFLFRR